MPPPSAIQIQRPFYPPISIDGHGDSRASSIFSGRLRKRERPVRISADKPEPGVAYDDEGRLAKHEWLGMIVDLYA